MIAAHSFLATLEKRIWLISTATVFLGAFLLFLVQPLYARLLLPKFGGSPAVWAVALCFFQTMLLAGYAYAHGLMRLPLSKTTGLALHFALLFVSFGFLPFQIPDGLEKSHGESVYLFVLWALLAGLGVPFFILSATAPLVQAWMTERDRQINRDPYVLYVASNIGSMGALLLYPTVIEPLFPLSTQGELWQILFIVLAILIVICGASFVTATRTITKQSTYASVHSLSTTSKLRGQAEWICLAFVPSALLVAFTTSLTTDLAAVPLLWVIPLALYLLTFIIAFRNSAVFPLRSMVWVQVAAAALTLWSLEASSSFAWSVGVGAGVLTFFLSALMFHRHLFEKRPEPNRLTEFYLCMSLGGALGGIFSSLVAPNLFTRVLEFPLLLGVASCTCLWLKESRSGFFPIKVAILSSIVAALFFAALSKAVEQNFIDWGAHTKSYVLAGLGLVMVALIMRPVLSGTLAIVMAMGAILLPSNAKPLYEVRNFFGVNRVHEKVQGRFHTLSHGTTLHGAQRIYKPDQPKPSRPLPLLYYHPEGPLNLGLRLARQFARSSLRVGIVGLGTGAMACNSQPGEEWSFFEIDRDVIEIARNRRLFTYLSDCQPNAAILEGDARLTLADKSPGSFDFLMLDAFSSDSIPVHLMTVEALRLYMSLLSEDGILALHISNQNLDLPPVIESNLKELGPEYYGVYLENDGTSAGLTRSQVALIAKNRDHLTPVLTQFQSRMFGDATVQPWTDNYSNVISALWRRYRQRLN